MALLEHKHLRLEQVLELVPTMPINGEHQRRLRAAIRRWARTLRDAGHDVGGDGDTHR